MKTLIIKPRKLSRHAARMQQRPRSALRGVRGESLIESLISIFIMSLLIVAVTIIIQTAVRISRAAGVDADLIQDVVGAVVLGDYEAAGYDDAGLVVPTGSVTFTLLGDAVGHPVRYYDLGGLRAFTPIPGP